MRIQAMLATATDNAMNTTFGRIWLCWVLFGVVLEIIALMRPAKGDTLSEWVWFIRDIPGYGTFTLWMLAAFMLWLIVHFTTKAV